MSEMIFPSTTVPYTDARIRFHKEGASVYFSHLDLVRCFSRVIARSGVQIWYTQGYNPHAHMVFALPLPLGFSSECEYCDVRLINDETFESAFHKLQGAMPPGMPAISVKAPWAKFQEIGGCRYQIEVFGACSKEKTEELFARPELPLVKSGKAGEYIINAREFFSDPVVEKTSDGLSIALTLAAGSQRTLNPDHLMRLFQQEGALSDTVQLKYRRKYLLKQDGSLFEEA